MPVPFESESYVYLRSHIDYVSWSYYGYSRNHAPATTLDQTKAKEFLKLLYDPKQTVWVGLGDTRSNRCGSIGIAVPSGMNHKDRSNWPAFDPTILECPYRYAAIDVHFDKGRKSTNMSCYFDGIYWLDTYTGPVVYEFKRSVKVVTPSKPVYDRLGNTLNVGDFVAYVGRKPYTTGAGELYFGFVEKRTDGGLIYVKNIKLSDDDTQRTNRIDRPEKVTKLNKDVIDQLMLRRLTF